MTLSRLDLTGRPYLDGKVWGGGSSYQLFEGSAQFAVDPAAAANAPITDLALAPRTGEGVVEFSADCAILAPAKPPPDPRLLVVVPNRGRIGSLPFSADTPALFGDEAFAPGDGHLLNHGWTLAWCGWQWDVPRGQALGLSAPVAAEGERPVTATIRVDFASVLRVADHPLSDSSPLYQLSAYPADDLEQPDAVLTVRDWVNGEESVVDRERWRFARDDRGVPVPDAGSIWLDGGFEPFRHYEVTYRTARCPVVGTGLLAVRDFASYLRHGAGGRFAAPAGVFGFGASQTGRFLREFVWNGLNTDEAGRRVFDGLLPHLAGGRLGEFNQRGGQPSHIGYTGSAARPPHSFAGPDGLLGRQRRPGHAPKVISTNTAWEYWRGDASLTHIDGTSGMDLAEDPGTRTYLFAGLDHLGANPVKAAYPVANGLNPLSYDLLLRAALANLVAWALAGVEPPASAVPRRRDGSAVERTTLLDQFRPLLPAVFSPGHLPVTREIDLGPDAAAGVIRMPVRPGPILRTFVSGIDADGNEVTGIRLPEVSVPVATYTGWNPRRAGDLPAALWEFAGSARPFAPARADRVTSGDPRASIAERYADRGAYERAVTAATARLVARRYLLAADAPRAVAAAMARWDEAVS